MATYRTISLDFWTDPKVDDNFTPEDKYFYLYLLTNPHTNICGCYQISNRQLERETGYSVDTINRLITRMEEYHGCIKYNSDTKEIIVIKWGKYNWSASDKLAAAVEREAEKIKCEAFKAFVLDALRNQNFEFTTSGDVVTEKQKEKPQIDYQKVIDSYHEICVSFPKVRSISAKRKKAISKLLKKYSDEDIAEAFQKAEASSFLKGKNDRQWVPGFDWITEESHMDNILEGTYDDRKPINGQSDYYAQVDDWVNGGMS